MIMKYSPRKNRILTREVRDRAYARLSPAEQMVIDQACDDVESLVRSRVERVEIGPQTLREIVAAVGRVLEALAR